MKPDDIEAAIAAVDRALREDAELVYDDLTDAVRHIVRLRDGLIVEARRGGAIGDCLGRVNAILSQIVGAEYPLEGIRRERIEKVRELLEALRDSVNGPQSERRNRCV
ncbi:MAG: hypothetical protein AB7H71_09235 [Alphaproteobacteria bacterium]